MSPVQAERRRPSWMRKAEPFAFIGPRVSNAKGMNVCVSQRLVFELLPFCCALSGGASGWWCGLNVRLSQGVGDSDVPGHTFSSLPWDLLTGRLPSECRRSISSLTAGTLARPRTHQTRSFRVWWRDVLHALRLQDRPCNNNNNYYYYLAYCYFVFTPDTSFFFKGIRNCEGGKITN